ncbi:hypothetical protein CALCODRAFT_485766 [Calocera cornea HHB12733]|uniref:Uncharacterized protein n=1 Tax=Calocera cornea HHB12733 TaxID=1353952 RepID=A0A165E612_9BASI|nr:hypothetical protein CALCODRAFT_485766 [Calocera cornea HHB12733]
MALGEYGAGSGPRTEAERGCSPPLVAACAAVATLALSTRPDSSRQTRTKSIAAQRYTVHHFVSAFQTSSIAGPTRSPALAQNYTTHPTPTPSITPITTAHPATPVHPPPTPIRPHLAPAVCGRPVLLGTIGLPLTGPFGLIARVTLPVLLGPAPVPVPAPVPGPVPAPPPPPPLVRPVLPGAAAAPVCTSSGTAASSHPAPPAARFVHAASGVGRAGEERVGRAFG